MAGANFSIVGINFSIVPMHSRAEPKRRWTTSMRSNTGSKGHRIAAGLA
jgi:hypothetical protein